MEPEPLEDTVIVRLAVTAHVDLEDLEMRERLADANTDNPAEVVASEVLTNLESVNYVRHVIVDHEQSKEDQS